MLIILSNLYTALLGLTAKQLQSMILPPPCMADILIFSSLKASSHVLQNNLIVVAKQCFPLSHLAIQLFSTTTKKRKLQI